jgi:hypothetical protein
MTVAGQVGIRASSFFQPSILASVNRVTSQTVATYSLGQRLPTLQQGIAFQTCTNPLKPNGLSRILRGPASLAYRKTERAILLVHDNHLNVIGGPLGLG